MEKLILFNTLSRKKEEFKPIEEGIAKIYCCGPTVYNFAHIGNLRAYFFEDILKRVLLYNGYKVEHVMNITDVGHLVSDDDEGEDKMEKGSAREGKTVWEIANFYTEAFKKDILLLNILPPTIYCKATDNISEQIDMISCLEKKGYTYTTGDGVYYDTSKFPDYGKLARLDIEGLEEGKRIEFSSEKRNKTDFALWKFSPKKEKRQMEWKSPWGTGFPGWHIECSAMSQKYLGETFDIHCGGIDHIPIHHTNEIAQAEACTGKKFVNYWLHGEFLIEEKGKMSKSSGEFLRMQTLIDKGYSPLDYRYFLLMTHYRKKIKFSFGNLDAARNGFNNLKERIAEVKSLISKDDVINVSTTEKYIHKFIGCINDDLNAGEGLALTWEMLRDDGLNPSEKILLANLFDKIFGLDLDKVQTESHKNIIPNEVEELKIIRNKAKENKDYIKADTARNRLKNRNYELIDTKDGTILKLKEESLNKIKEFYSYEEAVFRLNKFKELLKIFNIDIKKDSLLFRICNDILQLFLEFKENKLFFKNDNLKDYLSNMLGLNDLIIKILNIEKHENFNTLISHLNLLNEGSITQNTYSSVLDQNSNNIFELLIGSIAMKIGKNVKLINPKHPPKIKNADILLDYNNKTWAIECKVLHTKNNITLLDRVKEGIEQIEKSISHKGIVIVNLKNVIEHENFWITDKFNDNINNSNISHRIFNNINEPTNILLKYGNNIRKDLMERIEIKDLLEIFKEKKIIPGFLLFLQTSILLSYFDYIIPVSFGIFHFINMSDKKLEEEDYFFLNDLNTAMHLV